jgi:hypothetical protein
MITKELLEQEWIVNRLSQREIADKYSVSLGLVEARVKKYRLIGARSKVKCAFKEELFDLNNPIFCYYLGLFLSDGTLDRANQRCVISLTDDFGILKTLADYFKKDNSPISLYSYRVKGGKTIHRLIITSKVLVDLVVPYCGTNKTEDLSCPKFNNLECFRMFVRGFLDGDGNIRYINRNLIFRFYCHSLKFIEEFLIEFEKHYSYKLSTRDTKFKHGMEVSSRTDFTYELIKIYETRSEFCLERKRNVVKNLVDDIVHRYEMINHSNW